MTAPLKIASAAHPLQRAARPPASAGRAPAAGRNNRWIAGARTLALAVGLAGVLPFSAPAWIVETPREFISEGDFDGDGRLDALVLDKETGAGRVGFQNAANQVNWQPAFASGIANATSLAVGRLTTTARESIAVTSPQANRINKLEPNDLLGSAGITPTSIFPSSVGPQLVVATDIGGGGNTALDDYFLLTTENPDISFSLLRNMGTATSPLDDGPLSRAITSANLFEVQAGQGRRLGGILKVTRFGFADYFQVIDLSAGMMVVRLSFDLPISGAEFVAHRFGTNNPLAQVLFYQPGGADLYKYQFQETGADYWLTGSNRFRLGANLQLVQPLPQLSGARLLAFFGPDRTNLTTASIYHFDGTNAPVIGQSFTGRFSGALTLGNGNLALLHADGTGRATSHQVWLANGPGYVPGAASALPALDRFSGMANALLFDVEPFIHPNALARQLHRHADWSTAVRVTPSVRITGQEFLGSSNGLGNASTRDFGAPLSGVTTGLVNQYIPSISIFSGREALGRMDVDLRISPPAGHFGEAKVISISVHPTNFWHRFYRTSASQNWNTYTTPFLLLSNATVEFYAWRFTDGVQTPIHRARYTFNQSVSELDSDHDGVPDFVELSRGLDPFGGPDSDGDGFSDLEELARNTNPLSDLSAPLDGAALRTAFNRVVTPRPPHPSTGAPNRARIGIALRAFTLGGAFLGRADTSAAIGTGLTNPAALFANLLPEPGARLIVETTPDHYDLNLVGNSRVGRELLGLVLIPPTNSFAVHYVMGNGMLAAETTNWIIAASNAVATATNPTVAGLLTVENALLAGLLERHAANALLARGTNGATNATLFSFRSGDAHRRAITGADLRGLGEYVAPTAPGYRQETVFHFIAAQIRTNSGYTVLSNFARELWRISAAENNANQGEYPLPFDELRRLLAGQPLTPAYSNFKSIGTNLPTARTQANALLASVPARPRTNVTVVIAAAPSGSDPVRVQTLDGKPVTLWRFDGSPFAFPPNLQLLPGSELTVFAHTDLSAPAGTLAWEVISLHLTAVPMPAPGDADGNLLVDSWEEVFFGRQGSSAFADADADGYSNLQEMLAGTQPDDALGRPGGSPQLSEPPRITLNTEGGRLKFLFTWPVEYVNRFEFGLEASAGASGPYANIITLPLTSLGGDAFELQIPVGTDAAQFYRLTVKFRD